MNQEVKNAFDYALLARAAYAELDATMSNLGTALTTESIVNGPSNIWPSDLAIYFNSRYKVVDSELAR